MRRNEANDPTLRVETRNTVDISPSRRAAAEVRLNPRVEEVEVRWRSRPTPRISGVSWRVYGVRKSRCGEETYRTVVMGDLRLATPAK
jgi:hypothetical protein